MGKLKAGRAVREVTDSCMQYWGGMGYASSVCVYWSEGVCWLCCRYTSEVSVSRMYRDLRLLSIGAGADEVMLSIICKLSGTLPK